MSLMAFAASQPVDEAAAPAVIPIDEASAGKAIESNPVEGDMEASGSSLKIIEHKLEHWLKKCYKKGGCGSNAGNDKIYLLQCCTLCKFVNDLYNLRLRIRRCPSCSCSRPGLYPSSSLWSWILWIRLWRILRWSLWIRLWIILRWRLWRIRCRIRSIFAILWWTRNWLWITLWRFVWRLWSIVLWLRSWRIGRIRLRLLNVPPQINLSVFLNISNALCQLVH